MAKVFGVVEVNNLVEVNVDKAAVGGPVVGAVVEAKLPILPRRHAVSSMAQKYLQRTAQSGCRIQHTVQGSVVFPAGCVALQTPWGPDAREVAVAAATAAVSPRLALELAPELRPKPKLKIGPG